MSTGTFKIYVRAFEYRIIEGFLTAFKITCGSVKNYYIIFNNIIGISFNNHGIRIRYRGKD